MIIEPLAGPCSAISARFTTSTYQPGKSSCCLGSLSVLIGAPNASRWRASRCAGLAPRDRSQVAPWASALRLPAHWRDQSVDTCLDLGGAHGHREEIALPKRASERVHPLRLLLRLDPLRDRQDLERLAQRDDRTGQG